MNPPDYFDGIDERPWQTVESGTVRLSVVGLGQFARSTVLPSLSSASLVTVTALVSSDSEKANAIASDHGIDHSLDYEAFLDGERSEAYDAVYVGGPNAVHHEYGIAAAEHGKHVIVEKPITATPEQARRLVEACEKASVTLMVAYRPQIEPVLRRVRALVRDGHIGDVVQVHGGFSGQILGPDSDRDQWRLDAEMAGGGALLDVGVYPLNTTRFLLDSDPVAVQATTVSGEAPFDEVERHVAFQLSFPDGVTASLTASYDAYPDNSLRLIGTDGVVIVDPAYDAHVEPTVTVRQNGTETTVTPPFVDEVTAEFDYFAQCVLTGRQPEPDGHDGLVDMETVAAVYESVATGERVTVDEI